MISNNLNILEEINNPFSDFYYNKNFTSFLKSCDFEPNPINFIDPFGLCPEKTDKWMAIVGEASITAQVGFPNTADGDIKAIVLFQNMSNPDIPSITATYDASITGSIGTPLSISGSAEGGLAFADLPVTITPEEVVNSWSEEFNNLNVSVTAPTIIPFVSAGVSVTTFQSPNGLWTGTSAGPTIGAGKTNVSVLASETFYEVDSWEVNGDIVTEEFSRIEPLSPQVQETNEILTDAWNSLQ